MSDEQTRGIQLGFETAYSLIAACNDAGGGISLERIQTMTFMEFLTTIAAPNRLRFFYEPPPTKRKPPESPPKSESTEQLGYDG